jgi:cysteine desulfurase/selenocysteine lyase
MIDHSAVRSLFPGAQTQTYTDIAVRCLVSTRVREAVDGHLDVRMYQGGDKEYFHLLVEEARGAFASLIGAEPDEISVVKNVSEGLNAFASALPWRKRDNVIICPDLEHPNNVFLWYNLRKHHGIEVREVESPDGETVPIDRFVAAMDSRTRLVTVPSVSFAPGFITDVRTLAREAKSRSILTLVDAAQSIGALETNVKSLGCDALAVATQKSLLAFYGTGFLYCRRDLAETLEPAYLARYGVDLGPDAHETAIAAGDFRYAQAARRFDLGNFNYLGAAAARASLDLIQELGIANIEHHVRNLAHQLATGLHELGLPVAGGEPRPDLAHIVAVGTSGGGRHYSAADPGMNALYRRLTDNNVRLSIRRGVLRFSLGVYNDLADVERILEVAGRNP